jgi:hypothetical protein
MNTNKVYLFNINLLFIIVLPTLVLYCNKNNDDSSHTKKMHELYYSNETNDEILNLELNQIILNQLINSQIIEDSFEENKDTLLSLLQKDKNNMMLYRYSDYMCSSCIQEDLNLLNEFQKGNKSFKICVAVDYVENRENHIRFNSELEKFTHLRLDRALLSLPVNNTLGIESRYFTVLVNDEISYVFFPIRGNIKLTKMYFDLIENLN